MSTIRWLKIRDIATVTEIKQLITQKLLELYNEPEYIS